MLVTDPILHYYEAINFSNAKDQNISYVNFSLDWYPYSYSNRSDFKWIPKFAL